MIRLDTADQQLKEFITALTALRRLRRERKTDEARYLLGGTALSLLGMEYSTLTMADAASTAKLLGQPQRVVVLARLVAEDGELFEQAAEPARASARWGLALELFLEARALGAKLREEDAQVFSELRQKVAPTLLSGRHQELLARLEA